jgi:hypothetical protein
LEAAVVVEVEQELEGEAVLAPARERAVALEPVVVGLEPVLVPAWLRRGRAVWFHCRSKK